MFSLVNLIFLEMYRDDKGKRVDYKHIPLHIAFRRLYGKRDDRQEILDDFSELKTIIENEKHNYFEHSRCNVIATK